VSFARSPGTACILLAAIIGSSVTALAACIGPPAMVAKLQTDPTTENAILLGSWFAANKQFDCAIETFREAQKADPQSGELHYLEGLALVGAGQPAAAIPPLQDAIRLKPDAIDPHLLLADLYDQSGQKAKTDEQWKAALAIDPTSETALDGYSRSLIARGDFISVIGLLQHAPRAETLAIRLAQAYGLLNYLDDASRVLHEALQRAPESVALARAESVVLIKQGKDDDALTLLEYAHEHNPDNRDADLEYLRILVRTEHRDRARPLALKLLAQSPHDPEVLYLNGVLDHEVGEDSAAKAHLEEAVTQVPDFFYSHYHLGVVLVALHEWKEAKENLEKAIALGDTDAKVHYELGKALHAMGENDRATHEFQQYQELKKIEYNKEEAASHVALADDALAAGKLEEAIAEYRQACDMAPNSVVDKFKLSAALRKAGDVEGERTQLEQAVKLDPKLAGAQQQLGILLARSGDVAGAVEHFQMAVYAAPGWVEAWIDLAAELAAEAHFSDAREAAAMALRLDPANAKARKLSDQLGRDPAAQQGKP
jgi:tetratricopeptide (TPR) repeat protein